MSGSPPVDQEGVSRMAWSGTRRSGSWRVGRLTLVGSSLVAVPAARRRREADPERTFQDANKAFKAGRYAEADAALRSLERLRPTAARARGDTDMWRPTGDQTTTGYDLGAQGVTIALAYLDRR
jgi:hypothetical protein